MSKGVKGLMVKYDSRKSTVRFVQDVRKDSRSDDDQRELEWPAKRSVAE